VSASYGDCTECGRFCSGRVIATVEQGSGPGMVLVICRRCDIRAAARKAQAVMAPKPRRRRAA
jgi:hypothetical protein